MKLLNFKRIASVVASTLMVGSTVALAAAANYPAPFVQNGNADVAVVYGSNAVLDLVAVTDITSSLQGELAKGGTSGSTSSTTTVSGGDFVTLAKNSDKLNLGNGVTTVFGSTLSKDDLTQLLADGTYTNDNNQDFDYEQRITLGSGLRLEYFSDSDYNDRAPTVGINVTTGQVLLNYSLDFTSGAQSSVDSGKLVDLQTTTINLLGKEYYISEASNATNIALTLLDTANNADIKEGETKSVTVGSKSYDVMIATISGSASDPEVKLSINGETTRSLAKGGTYKLKDGTYVGIKDISIRDVAGNVGTVEFSLGTGKLELTNGQSIQLNDDSVQPVTAEIVRGTPVSGDETLDRINLVWTAQEDQFITPDHELVMPGLEAVKFSLGKFVRGTPEVSKVEAGATDYMTLNTVLKDGPVSVPLLYANSSGEFIGIGKSNSERLVTTSGSNFTSTDWIVYNYTAGDRYFVGSWNSSSESESYFLQFTNFINDNGVNKTTIQKKVDGNWKTVCQDRRAADTCSIGSLTLTVNSISPYPDRTVNVSYNAGGSFRHLYTADGLKVILPFGTATTNTSVNPLSGSISLNGTDANMRSAGHGYDTYNLVFREEDKDDNVAAGPQFNVTIDDNSNGEVDVSTLSTGRTSITDPDDSNHITNYVYSDVATELERSGTSSDQRVATINYPSGQSYADLVLTTTGAVVSSSGGSSGGATELGNVIVLDTEAQSVANKNLVVVGGSCVNSVAADLLGGALCGSNFQSSTGVGSGQFLVQTFARGSGKVATLVAGYDAGDTKNGATFLTTQSVDTTVGKKYVGTSSTTASLVTS